MSHYFVIIAAVKHLMFIWLLSVMMVLVAGTQNVSILIKKACVVLVEDSIPSPVAGDPSSEVPGDSGLMDEEVKGYLSHECDQPPTSVFQMNASNHASRFQFLILEGLRTVTYSPPDYL